MKKNSDDKVLQREEKLIFAQNCFLSLEQNAVCERLERLEETSMTSDFQKIYSQSLEDV